MSRSVTTHRMQRTQRGNAVLFTLLSMVIGGIVVAVGVTGQWASTVPVDASGDGIYVGGQFFMTDAVGNRTKKSVIKAIGTEITTYHIVEDKLVILKKDLPAGSIAQTKSNKHQPGNEQTQHWTILPIHTHNNFLCN